MKVLAAALVVLLSIPASAQEVGNRLTLICGGDGSANRIAGASAYGWDNRGNSANAIVTRSQAIGFEDTLQLWVEGGEGKVRLPRALLPKLHGGEAGWFDIRDVKISENEITGSAAVNALNHPKIVLDRLAGTVSVSGRSGQFSGRCQKFDAAAAKRAF